MGVFKPRLHSFIPPPCEQDSKTHKGKEDYVSNDNRKTSTKTSDISSLKSQCFMKLVSKKCKQYALDPTRPLNGSGSCRGKRKIKREISVQAKSTQCDLQTLIDKLHNREQNSEFTLLLTEKNIERFDSLLSPLCKMVKSMI